MQGNKMTREKTLNYILPFICFLFILIAFSLIFSLKFNSILAVNNVLNNLLLIYSSTFPIFLSILMKNPFAVYVGCGFFIVYAIFFIIEFGGAESGGVSMIQLIFVFWGFIVTVLGVVIGKIISNSRKLKE